MKMILVAATLMIFSATHAQAAESKSKRAMPEMTKEQRERMADVHEKMAKCLRSDKKISECHDEMKKAFGEDGESCPMGHMHGKHGMGKE